MVEASGLDVDAIIATPGVLGLVPGETTQIVLGPGRVTKVSEQFGAVLEARAGDELAARTKAAVKARHTSRVQTAVGVLGIGEPLIFGVTLPLGRPFVAACPGAGFGGVWMAVYDIGSIAFGPSGVALIPPFADGKYLLYVVGLLISYAGGFLVTRFWGFHESMVERLDRGTGSSERFA